MTRSDSQETLPPAVSASSTGRQIRGLIGAVIVLVIAVFLGRSIWSQWGVIRDYSWTVNVGFLLVSLAIIWADFLVLIALWRFLLQRIAGAPLRFGDAYRVWFLSNFGKYVPGKVWTILGMTYLLKRHGFSPPLVLAAAVLNQALSIVSGILLAVMIVGAEMLHLSLGLVSVLLIAGVVLLYPPLFQRLLNLGLRLVKRDEIKIDLSFGTVLLLFAIYVATWIAYGGAFWMMLLGWGIEPLGSFWTVTAVFAASYLVGFLALFAPGGLGVREGSLTVLLRDLLPAGLAAPVALLSRLWMTLAEILGAIPLLWLRRPSDTT